MRQQGNQWHNMQSDCFITGELAEIQKPQTKEEFERAKTENRKNAMKRFQAAAEQGCIPAFGNLFCEIREGRYVGGIDVSAGGSKRIQGCRAGCKEV